MKKLSFKERLIIHPDNKLKSIFDIFVLLLVFYSCIINVILVAYIEDLPETSALYIVNNYVLENFFYLDFFLSFISGYRESEDMPVETDLKKIAMKYFGGWFFVDFVSIFPFNYISKAIGGSAGTAQWSKLVRLARLPRLGKLIDISRI